MTEMSETRHADSPDLAPNPARPKACPRLARAVHDLRSLVGLAFLSILSFTGACVIPPSLSVEQQDAGQNSPPAILSVRDETTEYEEPGPLQVERGDVKNLAIELLDTDVTDTLQVRVFVDYTLEDPKAPRATCTSTTTTQPRRTVTCDVSSICTVDDAMDDEDEHMRILVFDRIPNETGEPPFQSMPLGGLSTSVFFLLKCQDQNL
ncbi:MAG: hypothetical protein WKG01_35670 [Kofleriaceae bacterium]